MKTQICLALLGAVVLSAAGGDAPQFNDKGELQFPADYREWVYLSSGLGMTYGPAAAAALNNPAFDNVYVHPTAWKSFKETGKWPEGTIFVLEIRYSTSHGSINKGGYFQTDVAAIEAEVKDSKRFPSGWGFFGFGGGLQPARAATAAIGANAGCQACHGTNGAVENTFTQFYPHALEIARKKGTVKASYAGLPATASPIQMLHALEQSPEVAKVLNDAKASDPTSPALSEMSVNMIGYNLLAKGSKREALAILEWNSSTHPKSANAADSLSEAYEANGQNAEALETAKKARQLLASDEGMNPARKENLIKAVDARIGKLGAQSK